MLELWLSLGGAEQNTSSQGVRASKSQEMRPGSKKDLKSCEDTLSTLEKRCEIRHVDVKLLLLDALIHATNHRLRYLPGSSRYADTLQVLNF